MVNFAAAEPSIIIYKTKQRTIVQFSRNKLEQDIVKLIKEFVVAKVKYYVFFEDSVFEQFYAALQKYFKNSQINMVKCTQKLIEVISVMTSIKLFMKERLTIPESKI